MSHYKLTFKRFVTALEDRGLISAKCPDLLLYNVYNSLETVKEV